MPNLSADDFTQIVLGTFKNLLNLLNLLTHFRNRINLPNLLTPLILSGVDHPLDDAIMQSAHSHLQQVHV